MNGFNKKTNSSSNKFDVVIQGKYYDYTFNLIEEYLKVSFIDKIIVSCWEDEDVDFYHERVLIQKNKYPQSYGTANTNLQILSSLNGLKKCTSKYAIKIRSDQNYTCSSLTKMYDFFIQNYTDSTEKIFVCGLYPTLLFHPRDHMFWGETQSLINLFSIPLEKNSINDIINVSKENLGKYYDCFVRAETYIGAHYCARFNESINRMIIKSSEYLFDGSPNWYSAKEISDSITFNIFKSFPKSIIDFNWLGKTEWNIPGIPWKLQPYLDDCVWNEDGY